MLCCNVQFVVTEMGSERDEYAIPSFTLSLLKNSQFESDGNDSFVS
jgi:hypothetical protein